MTLDSCLLQGEGGAVTEIEAPLQKKKQAWGQT